VLTLSSCHHQDQEVEVCLFLVPLLLASFLVLALPELLAVMLAQMAWVARPESLVAQMAWVVRPELVVALARPGPLAVALAWPEPLVVALVWLGPLAVALAWPGALVSQPVVVVRRLLLLMVVVLPVRQVLIQPLLPVRALAVPQASAVSVLLMQPTDDWQIPAAPVQRLVVALEDEYSCLPTRPAR